VQMLGLIPFVIVPEAARCVLSMPLWKRFRAESEDRRFDKSCSPNVKHSGIAINV
jgi:hypothetical protein